MTARSRRSRVLAVCCACAWPWLSGALLLSGAPARELEAGEVLARLQAWLDGTRDLEGRFEQKLVSGALGAGLEERGRLYLARPGKMRWDYLDPERKIAIIEGRRTRLYIEEERELWEGTLDDDALLATLLAGSEPIAAGFEAGLLTTPRHGGRGAYRLQLVPHGPVEALQEIVLTLREPGFAIAEAEVTDGAGNRMLYRFIDLRRNRGLADSTFEFEAPPGTEIGRH